MSAVGVVDGVQLPHERYMLVAKKFKQSKFKFKGFESNSGKSYGYRQFIFSKLETTGMFTIIISDGHAWVLVLVIDCDSCG